MNINKPTDHTYTNYKVARMRYESIRRQGGKAKVEKFRVDGKPIWRLRIKQLPA